MRGAMIDRWKSLWLIVVAGFFAGSVALVFTGDELESEAAAAEGAPHGESKFDERAGEATSREPVAQPGVVLITKTPEGCLADAATLEDLRRQKTDLETKLKEVAAREAELKARERALNEQIKTLAEMREDMEKIERARKAESDGKVAKLVETVEVMTPKAGATLLASVDEGLATATMSRLTTPKLAKIMNVMDPTRSSRLSELLAGVARARVRTPSNDGAAATTDPAKASYGSGPSKGGERK